MKLNPIFKFITVSLFITACGGPGKTGETKVISDSLEADSATFAENKIIKSPGDSILGYYVGEFVAEVKKYEKMPMLKNRINISLDSIKDNVLFGHSVVAGNNRPFKGSLEKGDGIYSAEVREPGNNKYDGVFTFEILPGKKTLSGAWVANDTNLAVSQRSFQLEYKTFTYNPAEQMLSISDDKTLYKPEYAESDNHYITPDAAKINASLVALTSKDVENMYKRDLEIMRNAIYARHGYSFQNREIRYFFDTEVDWYIPVSTNVTKDLTALEKKNIALIKRYEKHAEMYYDDYGR